MERNVDYQNGLQFLTVIKIINESKKFVQKFSD